MPTNETPGIAAKASAAVKTAIYRVLRTRGLVIGAAPVVETQFRDGVMNLLKIRSRSGEASGMLRLMRPRCQGLRRMRTFDRCQRHSITHV